MIIKLLYAIKTSIRKQSLGTPDILFSFIFTFSMVFGYLLTNYESIDLLPITPHWVIAYSIGSTVIWLTILLLLLALKKKILGAPSRKLKNHINISDRKLWLLTSFFIFVCYLPIIALCMSVLTPDSWVSIEQIRGVVPLSNAHPIIFTEFAGIFVRIGLFLGNLELGIILFSLAQSAVLSMIFGWSIVWLRKLNYSKTILIFAFIYYAILPINAVAGIIMWKDILFAGFALLFLTLLRRLYIEKDAFFKRNSVAGFIVLGFLFCVWRNNGLYAYSLFFVLAILVDYKYMLSRKYIGILVTPIVLALIYTNSMSLLTGPSTKVAIMSVPLQQIARTVKYHDSSISKSDKAMINDILNYNKLAETYNPNLSDPVLYLFKNGTFEKDERRYAGLWFRLFVNYKKTFMASFLYNSYGYMYPYFVPPAATDILLDNASHKNAPTGYTDSSYILGGKQVVTLYKNIVNSVAPILMNIGFYTFVILLTAYISIVKQKRELTGVFIILLCLFLTTIVSPVNGEFRYLYLFVVASPFMLGSAFSAKHSGRNRVSRG